MKPELAAKALLDTLHMPLGSISVLVWYGDSKQPVALKVWVEPTYLGKAKGSVPDEYEGYKVVLEERPNAFALH